MDKYYSIYDIITEYLERCNLLSVLYDAIGVPSYSSSKMDKRKALYSAFRSFTKAGLASFLSGIRYAHRDDTESITISHINIILGSVSLPPTIEKTLDEVRIDLDTKGIRIENMMPKLIQPEVDHLIN